MQTTISEKAWHRLHLWVNRIANCLAGPPYFGTGVDDYLAGEEGPRNMHWLWRLNDWVADCYLSKFVERLVKERRDA